MIDLARSSVCCILLVGLLLPIAGNGEEEKSIAIQISVCRASGLSCWTFDGIGLFSCLVCVVSTDTRVSIPSFWWLLFVVVLLLSALAGVQEIEILAREFYELNSFHLGQDCPQSFELNSFHLG